MIPVIVCFCERMRVYLTDNGGNEKYTRETMKIK